MAAKKRRKKKAAKRARARAPGKRRAKRGAKKSSAKRSKKTRAKRSVPKRKRRASKKRGGGVRIGKRWPVVRATLDADIKQVTKELAATGRALKAARSRKHRHKHL